MRTSWVLCRAFRLALALARGTPHSALRTRHVARGTWHVALGTRHSALGTRHAHAHAHAACGMRHSHSALGTRHAARARARARGMRHSHSALGTRHSTSVVAPSDRRKHVDTSSFVPSDRPRTPQPASRGSVPVAQLSRADDSAHIRPTYRPAAERGQDGRSEHLDPCSRKLRAAHGALSCSERLRAAQGSAVGTSTARFAGRPTTGRGTGWSAGARGAGIEARASEGRFRAIGFNMSGTGPRTDASGVPTSGANGGRNPSGIRRPVPAGPRLHG